MREELAELMYIIWAGWAASMLGRCVKGNAKSLVIPRHWVNHWDKQIIASYDELPEKEKDSNRKVADKVLALFAKHLLLPNTVIERNPVQSMPERIAEARHAMVGWNKYYKVSVGVIECWLDYIEDGEWSAEEGNGDE